MNNNGTSPNFNNYNGIHPKKPIFIWSWCLPTCLFRQCGLTWLSDIWSFPYLGTSTICDDDLYPIMFSTRWVFIIKIELFFHLAMSIMSANFFSFPSLFVSQWSGINASWKMYVVVLPLTSKIILLCLPYLLGALPISISNNSYIFSDHSYLLLLTIYAFAL